jgi:WD40 repeat protein
VAGSSPASQPAHQGASDFNGIILTSSSSLAWKSWSLNTFEEQDWPNLLGSESPIVCASQNPLYPSTVFIVLDDGTAGVVDLNRRALVRPTWFTMGRGPRKCLVAEDPNSFDNPAFIVIAEVEKSIHVYSKTAELIYSNTLKAVITAVYAWRGELFIGASDGTVTQQQLFGKRLVETWQAHDFPITCVSVMPVPMGTDLILTGSYDSFLKAWRSDNSRLEWQVRHTRTITCLSCIETSSPHDIHRAVAACGAQDGSIYVYAPNGTLVNSFAAHSSNITCLELSSDILLSASGVQDPTVRVWAWKTASPLAVLSGHTSGIFHLKIFSNSSKAASASNDGSIRIWNLTSNTLETRLMGHSNSLTAFCICE